MIIFVWIAPQTPSKFKEVESAKLWVNDDIYNENDYLQIDIELVNVIHGKFSYTEIYLNDLPQGLGDGYTANEKGLRVLFVVDISFRDGTDQTYLAIVHLKGDPCKGISWLGQKEEGLHVSTLMNDRLDNNECGLS